MNGMAGAAVFLKPEPDWVAMRRAAKRALLENAQQERFLVTYMERYYIDELDRQIWELYCGRASELEAWICGEEKGAKRCAALMDIQQRYGVLVHRQDGLIRLACFPVPGGEELRLEQEIVHRLRMLAEEAKGLTVAVDEPVRPGVYDAEVLLKYIAAQFDIQK